MMGDTLLWFMYRFGRLGGVVVVLQLVTFGSFRAYGRHVYASDSDDKTKIYRIQQAKGVLYVLVAVAMLVVLYDAVPFAFDAFSVATSLTNNSWLVLVPLGFLFGTFLLFAYFGTFLAGLFGYAPYALQIRDATTTRRALLKGVVVQHGLFWVVCLGITAFAVINPRWGFALGVLTVALAYHSLDPYIATALGYGDPLPESLEDRFGQYDPFELPYRSVKLLDTEDEKVAEAMVSGIIPGYQHLFVTNYLLKELPPAETDAVIAHGLGFLDRNLLAVRHCSAVVPFVVLPLVFEPTLRWILAALLLTIGYYVIVHGRLSSYVVFAADAYAAKQTDADTTKQMLRTLSDLNTIPERSGRVDELLSFQPSIEKRIEQLETR